MTEQQGEDALYWLGIIAQMAMVTALGVWFRLGWDWAWGMARRHGINTAVGPTKDK